MKLSLKNIAKAYSISNIVFYKTYNIIYNENIDNFLSNHYILYNHAMLQLSNILPIIMIFIFFYYEKILNLSPKKYNKILNLYPNGKKIVNIIFMSILFIFIKNIENAI